MISRHFVIFFSPGTFVAETTEKPIDSWDVSKAVEISRAIRERYGATPYGFSFITRARDDEDLDSHEVSRSGIYYLGGKVRTLEDVERENDPSERILRDNMRVNGWHRIITNCNSWSWTQPLRDQDVVLDMAGQSGSMAS